MFDKEQFKKEIEVQLYGVPKNKSVAFAMRSAMRVLPLLATKQEEFIAGQTDEVFLFWKITDRNEYLLAILNSYTFSMEYIMKGSNLSRMAYTDNVLVAVDAATSAAYANVNAAYAPSTYVIAAAAAAFSGHTVNAANHAIVATSNAFLNNSSIIQEIREDLSMLNKMSAENLLQAPLWSNAIPEYWRQQIAYFKADISSLNAGFNVWLDWYDDRLQGKPIDVELLTNWNTIPETLRQQGSTTVNDYLRNLKQWNNLPKEILAQGDAAISEYLKNLEDKISIEPLNRVRAIFIGYGEAGKTSLIRALYGEPVVEGKEDMTAGIDIRDWSIPNSDIKAHFWDFGGQVMAHATHQFFLRSSCLYVLVLNARSEINSTEQAEYWLEHVKGFGENSPVMIVGNKSDKAGINLDMSYLKDKYANIVDFYPVSCTQAETKFRAKFDSFKQDFCQQLRYVGTHQMMFTKEQFGVLKVLRNYASQKAFLKHQEFINICTTYNIGTEGLQNRDWLLDILDKLGVVIHFPQLACLDEYVLNPRWLTHGVYTLMYKRQAKLTLHEVVAILRDKPIKDEQGNVLDYPSDKCRFIMDAMQEFKLCYSLPNNHNTLIIPELLPTDQPKNISFKKQGALAFEFVFRGFLPRHVMPELIVNRHEEIINEVVWQRGVLLKHKIYQAQSLIQVDYHERALSIWVQGRDAKDYLSLLNDEVLKILGRLDLDYKEWIALPLSACISDKSVLTKTEEKAPYRQILANARENKAEFISESGLSYDLSKVLGFILSKEKQNEIINNFYNSNPTLNQQNEADMSKGKTVINAKTYIAGDVKDQAQVAGGNIINNTNANNADLNVLLEKLLAEITALNEKVPASQAIKDIKQDAETLVAETQRESPRHNRLGISLDGIKEAALALGEAATPILAIAKDLSLLLAL